VVSRKNATRDCRESVLLGASSRSWQQPPRASPDPLRIALGIRHLPTMQCPKESATPTKSSTQTRDVAKHHSPNSRTDDCCGRRIFYIQGGLLFIDGDHEFRRRSAGLGLLVPHVSATSARCHRHDVGWRPESRVIEKSIRRSRPPEHRHDPNLLFGQHSHAMQHSLATRWPNHAGMIDAVFSVGFEMKRFGHIPTANALARVEQNARIRNGFAMRSDEVIVFQTGCPKTSTENGTSIHRCRERFQPSGCSFFYGQRSRGCYRGGHRGALRATGSYSFSLIDDVTFSPTALAELASVFDDPEIVWRGGPIGLCFECRSATSGWPYWQADTCGGRQMAQLSLDGNSPRRRRWTIDSRLV